MAARGACVCMSVENQLKITANNPEQGRSGRDSDVSYGGRRRWKSALTLAMCWTWLNALKRETVRIMLTDSVSSVQIEDGRHSRRRVVKARQ